MLVGHRAALAKQSNLSTPPVELFGLLVLLIIIAVQTRKSFMRLSFGKKVSFVHNAKQRERKTLSSQMSQQFRFQNVPFLSISLKLASAFSTFFNELHFHPKILLLLNVPLFALISAREDTKAGVDRCRRLTIERGCVLRRSLSSGERY